MRTIKPGFFTNELLCELHPLGRILFEGLWCWGDREGRLEDRPRKFKAEILPYDRCNVDQLLQGLERRGFIRRYEAAGVRYIQVVNFRRHQNPHLKEPPSTIPAPDAGAAGPAPTPDRDSLVPVLAPDEHGASTVPAPDEHDARNPPSRAGHGPWVSGHLPQAMDPGPQEASSPSEHSLQDATARASATAIERARALAVPKPGETPEALAHRQALVAGLTDAFHGESPPNRAERERIDQAAGLLYESRVGLDELPRLIEAARERWSGDVEITPIAVARQVSALRAPRAQTHRPGRNGRPSQFDAIDLAASQITGGRT